MRKRNANGAGTIRKKAVKRGDKTYIYWEGRITVGRDPATGKQVQRSFTGKSQREVRQKMQEAALSVDNGTYTAPQKVTVGQWLDIWQRDYLGNVKPRTRSKYEGFVRLHLKPAFGSVRLQALQPHTIQKFINELSLAPSTARQACNVLSAALEQAEALDLIERNPVTRCTLPRIEKARELHVLSDPEIHSLLDAAEGRPIEPIIRFALFTGARMSEILALTWDCIDFDNGAIAITKQLAPAANRKSGELFTSTKNGKPRTIAAASVLALLKDVHRGQLEARMLAGSLWDNPHDLVFTDGIGHALPPRTVAHWFESVRAAADLSDVRFHDLRHGYAILALRAGDSPKAVQGNLGHATASFTLDVYADYSDEMRKASARKIEDFLRENFNLNSGKGKNKGKST